MASLALVLPMLGGLDAVRYKAALAPFQDCLQGVIAGPKWSPYFSGLHKGIPFSAHYLVVRERERHGEWKSIVETRLKFAVPTAHRLRILNRSAVITPLSYRLTLLGTVESGAGELDGASKIYAADPGAARALCADRGFVGLVRGIFGIPYDRVDITPGGVEIRERHYVPDGEAVYSRENILKAADGAGALAAMLRAPVPAE